jgi:hypothetical protein
MPGSDELPEFREKRKILFGEKTEEEQLRQTGRQFMEAEQYDDALEFFARCDAADEVREIIGRARETANTPLYLRAKVVLGEKPDEAELLEMAEKARKAGRTSMALVAYQKSGHEEQADELREELLAGEEPVRAPGEEPQTEQDNAEEPAQ